jgi:hypothetical protein
MSGFVGLTSGFRRQLDNMSLICDKSVTTQNLAFLSYWYKKKRLQMHF